MIIKHFEDKSEEMLWMIDYIEKKKEKRGIKPVVIPNFIKKSKSCMPIDLEFFKEVFTSKKGIGYAFDKLNNWAKEQGSSGLGYINFEKNDNTFFYFLVHFFSISSIDRCRSKRCKKMVRLLFF